ncbi:MAG: DUF4282 domain-containing protein [Planctomycetota bacterium]|nr:DUF4282 domain-containing protein [Planctomycetota bacterium]
MDGIDDGSAAREAKLLDGGAKKALGEIKGGGLAGFFNFDRLYFLAVARVLFMLVCALILLATLAGLLGGLIAMVGQSVLGGLGVIAGALIFGAVSLLAARVWFEMLVVAFRINENLEAIRDK